MNMRISAALVVALLALAACDDDGASVRDPGATATGGSGTGSGSGSGTEPACEPDEVSGTLQVALDEFSVSPAEDEITSGPTKLLAVNAGELAHELMVVQARSLESLPLDGENGVDEEALGEEKVIAEIEEVPPGEACLLEVDLEPATYVLLCNIVDEGEDKPRSHFLRGMRARVKVS
jgi:hypothetical protein